MDFDERDRHSRQGIAQGDAGMGESRGIDDYPSDLLLLGQLRPVDERSLVVALEADHRRTRKLRLSDQAAVDIRQGFATIDLRLAGTQQVQIGSMQDQYLLRDMLNATCRSSRRRAGNFLQHMCEFAANRCQMSSFSKKFADTHRVHPMPD